MSDPDAMREAMAPTVHEFQIRESDPWYGEFVATEGETWFVFAHEFKAYREWVLKLSGELQAKVSDVQAGVSALDHDRDTWKRVAEHAGVCMTCALGAPDLSIGCTDCLNTGFAHGAPQGYVSEGFYEEAVSKLQRRLENRQDTINVLEDVITKLEQACARKKPDGSWDFAGPCSRCGAADEHVCGRGARGYLAKPIATVDPSKTP